MMGWLIFGLIVMLILFLMLIRLRLVIEADDRFFLQLKVLWMTFRVIPSNKKEKKIKLRDYEIKRVRKGEEKANNKRRKAARKAAENKKKNQNGASEKSENIGKEKSDIIGMIKLVWVLLKDIKSAVIGHIGIDLEKMYIVVSSDDAANTALLYGAVTQGANLLFEFLRNTTGFRMTGDPKDIAVIPDFGFGSITVKLKLILHIRIWQIFALAFQVLFSFLKYQMKNKSNQIINKNAEEEQHG